MSSKPHKEGVAEVVAMLGRVDSLETEAAELIPKAERLRAVESELLLLKRRLPELLRSMDVESPGNFGWESRMGWFLAEMRRQLLASGMGGVVGTDGVKYGTYKISFNSVITCDVCKTAAATAYFGGLPRCESCIGK